MNNQIDDLAVAMDRPRGSVLFDVWEVFLEGERVENMTGFKLEVGMDFVPQLTITLHALDIKIDDAKWDPNLPGVSWLHEDKVRPTIEQIQEGADVH